MRSICTFLFCLLLIGCGGDQPPPKETPRTVVVTTLKELIPQPPFQVTGIAEPYREAEVSFEVAGRVTAILDVGRSVEVHTREKTSAELKAEREARTGGQKIDPLFSQGDVIAQLDETSYRQRLDAAKLSLATAEAGLRGMVIDYEEVGPASVARSRAQRDAALSNVEASRAMISSYQSSKDKAERDLARNTKLLNSKQISRSEYDQYQTAFDGALANLDRSKAALTTAQEQAQGAEAALTEARASLRLKEVNVARGKSEVAELQVALDQARTDLERCTLRAPFSGRITQVHASHGDYVSAGRAVLTLTLIDPIKVSVTVSADRERLIQPGNYARVIPKRLADYQTQEAMFGTVFEKGAVADPTTRTFRIDVMVRNLRQSLSERSLGDIPRISFRELLPAVERHRGEGGPLFVCAQCCVPQGDHHVVYRVKGVKWGEPRPSQLFAGSLQLERLEVAEAGRSPADFMQILNWSFRSVKPGGGAPLENGDLLISFDRLDPKDVADKGVVLERYEWAIRPGDLVPVSFDTREGRKGFWVPDEAIRAQNDKRSIFVVEDGKSRQIPVNLVGDMGRLRLIEGEGLKAGMKLVVLGVHYVHDGGPVAVLREFDLEKAIETQQ